MRTQFYRRTEVALPSLVGVLDGMTTTQPHGGYAAAIALVLPVGAGWLLLKTIRRRRLVLAAMIKGA